MQQEEEEEAEGFDCREIRMGGPRRERRKGSLRSFGGFLWCLAERMADEGRKERGREEWIDGIF